jgi:hypothetical protein
MLVCFVAFPARAADAPPTTAGSPAATEQGRHAHGAPTKEELKRYKFNAEVECPYCGETPEHPQGRRGLHWHDHWRKVGIFEYIATPVLLGVAAGVQFFAPKQTHAYWRGPILFDRKARDIMMYKTRSARKTAEGVSDGFAYASVAYPYLVDDMLVTWLARQSPEVAWQMFVINSQAYATTWALIAVTKRATGRERPFGDQCTTNPDGYPCNQAFRYQSFFSGHAALTATGAGLVCTHHTQLRLYQNPAADTIACLAAISLTAATGVLRMTSNVHWASDVIVGDVVGFASGYLLPTLVYYKTFHIVPPPAEEQPSAKPRVAVLPVATPGMLELTAIGLF